MLNPMVRTPTPYFETYRARGKSRFRSKADTTLTEGDFFLCPYGGMHLKLTRSDMFLDSKANYQLKCHQTSKEPLRSAFSRRAWWESKPWRKFVFKEPTVIWKQNKWWQKLYPKFITIVRVLTALRVGVKCGLTRSDTHLPQSKTKPENLKLTVTKMGSMLFFVG